MSVKVEKLLMGRTLTGTYFGGKCEEAIEQVFFFWSMQRNALCSEFAGVEKQPV